MRGAQSWLTSGAIGLLAFATASCREVSAPIPDAAIVSGCVQPAPFLGREDPAAPGVIVVYREGVDVVIETNRLASKYAFTPAYVYTAALHGFAATLTPEAVAGVRCEPSVASVEHNAVVHAD